MSDEYRQVFYFELAPGRFVSINMRGPFDSDMYAVLKGFMDRHATHPATKMFTQEHHYLQGEHGYVWHQGCGCSPCWATYKRIEAEQQSQSETGSES